MVEVGKCYAQFCYGYGEEFVFLEKIDFLAEGSYSSYGITIEKDAITSEGANYAWPFEEDEYVEIPNSLFDELFPMLGVVGQIENPELSKHYIAKFKEICKGHWRDIAKEDKQNESNAI